MQFSDINFLSEFVNSFIKKKVSKALKHFVTNNCKYVLNSQHIDLFHTFISEGTWSQWSNWGDCSVTCSVGVWSRNRTCTGPGKDGPLGICTGNGLDVSTCNNEDCNRKYFFHLAIC